MHRLLTSDVHISIQSFSDGNNGSLFIDKSVGTCTNIVAVIDDCNKSVGNTLLLNYSIVCVLI